MGINAQSIADKMQAYIESDAGVSRRKKYVDTLIKSGKNITNSGREIIGKNRIHEATEKFISILKAEALKSGLPDSVMEHITGISASNPVFTSSGCSVNLYFAGDLHRDSLENDYKEYDGIDNIVALFNNGVHAKDYTYGWWNNRKPTGEAIGRSMPGDTFAWVRSQKDREALLFMQKSADLFNRAYGKLYNVTVSLASIYEQTD